LALLIFDRNLMPMPYPVITRILSISVSQTCGSLWPGWKSLRQKKSKKDCQKEYELHRKLRKWPDCIFLHLLIQSFWVPCDLSSKNFSKKTYYLKLRFMCQDMPRMQDFAPFTPELLGALSGPRLQGPPRKKRVWLDNLNFDLGCPNDYKIFLGVSKLRILENLICTSFRNR
jgi:hypothetical protein